VLPVPASSTAVATPTLEKRRVDPDQRALQGIQQHRAAIATFLRRNPGRNAQAKTLRQTVAFMREQGIVPANHQTFTHYLELLRFRVHADGTVTLT
jgi:hypothetical protein